MAGKDGLITYVDEYRFMLYRHWSLFDSMYHSDYVATRLGTWTNETLGKQKLETLLVHLGIPNKESHQRYVCTRRELLVGGESAVVVGGGATVTGVALASSRRRPVPRWRCADWCL